MQSGKWSVCPSWFHNKTLWHIQQYRIHKQRTLILFYWFKKYRAISIGWFKNKWLLWTDSLKDFFKNLTNSGTRLKQSNEFLTVWSKYIIQSVYLSIMSQFFLVNQKHIESESKTNVSYELIQKPDRINLLNHFITSIRLINTQTFTHKCFVKPIVHNS